LESYLADLVNREVMQLSTIEHGRQLRQLITLLAGRVGQIINLSNLAGPLGLSQRTVERYVALLEEVFLIKRLPAWSRSTTKRATHAPKLAFVDTGIAAMLLGHDQASLTQITSPLGGVLESFAAMEIARQLTWASQTIDLAHYRTRDQVEVDIVLQNRRGQVVGVEVKAAASVANRDFSGLRHLQRHLGDSFLAGVVLYLGPQSLPFGPRLRAMPLSALWECG